MRVRQSVCVPILKPAHVGLDEFFAAVAEIGYEAVETWGRGQDFTETAKLAARHKLRIASTIGVSSLTDGLNRRENHDRIEAELRESIDVAAQYGIPGLICFSGNRRPGLSEEEAAAITAEGLRRVASCAEKKGVNLNLELLNSKVNHKGYQCDHTAWGASVCEQVGSPRVKLLYDIYHMQIMEGDIIRTIKENIQRIGHFHTAGVPGRNDMDDSQELNYAAISRAIAETEYAGYVGHEFSPKGDAIEALRKTFALFDGQ